METSQKYWVSKNERISRVTLAIFNEYLLSLKLENNAESTIIKYKKNLERFLSECSTPLQELNSEVFHKWFLLFSKNKEPRTIELMLSCLSSFFKFCMEEEYLETKIIKKRWWPNIPKSLPRYLDEKQFAQVKLAAEKLNPRDRTLVLFLFTSGCRRSEASYLKLENINLKKRTALVRGKGNKLRTVHFSEECAFAMEEYLQIRTGEDNGYLFLNRFGERLCVQSIFDISTKLGKVAGLSQSLHPHCCRHTFATNMLARGASLENIADELGHRNLNTTRVYARIPTEDLINAYHNKKE